MAVTNSVRTDTLPRQMKRRKPSRSTAALTQRWARRLNASVESVLAANPQADRDNVRHTLILLEQPPLERLQKSLIRGRHTAIRRK
jgi:hypothetical protein